MKTINALSLTANAKHWLKSSHQPRVLHVFDRACNLINERGNVLSIVTTEIGDGPFNLVIEKPILFMDHMAMDSSVCCSRHSITIGNIVIHIVASATLWNPRPQWETLYSQQDDISKHLDLFHGVHHFLPIHQSLVFAQHLSSSLADGDASTSSTMASKIAGLGVGLTPAGDDFLMGALYAAWIIHPLEVVEPLAGEIVKTAAPLTTSLSGAWLRAAGNGEAGILWHELFAALVSSNGVQIQSAIDKILGIGATSGADALTGFIETLNAYTESQRKHVLP